MGKVSAQPSGELSGSQQETDGPPTCECRATDEVLGRLGTSAVADAELSLGHL